MTNTSKSPGELSASILSKPISHFIQLDVEKSIYLLFIVLALVTRLVGIGDRVVSHDESLHTQYSYQYYNGDGYRHQPLMHGPSLFHATAFSYWLFGVSDGSSRIPVALLGTVLVILPYFLRKWMGKTGALIASFLLLISPYITYYSRYIRHDIYVIVAAVITFIAIQNYLRRKEEKFLWWLAMGLALMFITMETSFIYVAIFGSFLILRLLARLITAEWLPEIMPDLKRPMALLAVSIIVFSVGFIGQRSTRLALTGSTPTPEAEVDQGFAADPQSDLTPAAELAEESAPIKAMRWTQVAGLLLISGALFLTAKSMRRHIIQLAEFDLVLLLTTLTLPSASAFLIVTAGYNPLVYTQTSCVLAGQETMSAGQLFVGRLFNSTCLSAYASSGVFVIGAFVALTLIVSILVGLWWNKRRWLIAAAIYHGIFVLFFTSFFTNPDGWSSGTIRSLGYWLAQQEVRRASQPWFFYFIVLPIYEFLPLFFSILAVNLWAKSMRIGYAVRYWVSVLSISLLIYSFTNWLVNRGAEFPDDQSKVTGLLVAVGLIVVALAIWFIQRRRSETDPAWRELVSVDSYFGFVPYVFWWAVLSWVIFSLAGEKMAWLSTHFIFPMVLLSGWYVDRKLSLADARRLLSRSFLILVSLSALTLIAAALVILPVLMGRISLLSQRADDLANLGRFLGSLFVAIVVIFFVRRAGREFTRQYRHLAFVIAIFTLLSILTIRFAYMAAFPNADYTNEFLVYAHGAPATKSDVLPQLEELSMRLYGDKSINVAYDNDSSWPYTWYLRDYPNRTYFGENPTRTIKDSPALIVGSLNWGKVEPILGDDYQSYSYIFLWWPMEDYRRISWDAVFGNPEAQSGNRRGLANPELRQALWDIFMYRDYRKYGQVMDADFSVGQWPLRHELRLYIRRDVLANLWDYGLEAAAIEPPVDPYAENNLELVPVQVFGTAGSEEGQLSQPRDMVLGPDGLLYVADSGNHRIQVFDGEGQFIREWGSFGSQPGTFNEPWGIAVSDSFVFVADTWNHRVQKFSLEGELLQIIGQSGSPVGAEPGGGLFFGPRDIVLLDDGSLLVSDTGNHRLQLFDQEGNFIQAIGGQGGILGQFYEPVGIGLAANGQVFVADTWNGRIQRLNQELLPVSEFPVEAWFSQSINNKPYVAVDSGNRVYVSDPEGYRVLMFDPLGNYLGRFGAFSTGLDGFGLPNGITIGDSNEVYIADAGNNRILKFAPLDLTQR